MFAGAVSCACLLLGLIFLMVTLGGQIWAMAIPTLLFFLGTYATSAAAASQLLEGRPKKTAVKTERPIVAVVALLIGVYAWGLTLAMHVFGAFFKNGPGSIKYFITLGIAIAATLFTQFYGRRVVITHFGHDGGRKLELNPAEIIAAVVTVISFSLYFVWVAL